MISPETDTSVDVPEFGSIGGEWQEVRSQLESCLSSELSSLREEAGGDIGYNAYLR